MNPSPDSTTVTDTARRDTDFRFFKHIAEDLTRVRLAFPTFLQASASVREALTRQDCSSAELAQLVSREPLLSARVVALANSAALNPTGIHIADVRTACLRVGHRAVRSLAASLLVEQAAGARELGPFATQAREIWEHSLAVAVMAYVLAEHSGSVSPDEAMFAGLVHDLGHFYLYWQATRFEELVAHPAGMRELVHGWHAAIGQRLLLDLQVPEPIALACELHEEDPATLDPGSLSEVLCVANLCSMARAEGSAQDDTADTASSGRLDLPRARAILRDHSARVADLLVALMGATATAH